MSGNQLWWKKVTPPGDAASQFVAVGTAPVWQLMSGSGGILSAPEIVALSASNWASEGTPPLMELYQYAMGFPAPVNGAAIRYFLTGSSGVYVDTLKDAFGFSSMSLACVDFAQAYFAPVLNFVANKSGSNYAVAPINFPSSIFVSDQPAGPFAVFATVHGALSASISSIVLNYGTTSATSSNRVGLFVPAVSGSPPVSFEPIAQQPVEIFEGDVWFYTGSVARSGASSFYLGEKTVSGSVLIAKVLTTRASESASAQLFSRLSAGDRPTGSVLAVNSVVVDEWFYTYNSSDVSGAGWQNLSWGGGIYMPDSSSVAVYGSGKDFRIPSGNFIVSKDIIATGSVYMMSGSISLITGSISIITGSVSLSDPSGTVNLTGDAAALIISGSQARAFLRGWPIVNVASGTIAPTSLVPQPSNGTLYVKQNTAQAFIRISGSWIEFAGNAPAVVDGGTY